MADARKKGRPNVKGLNIQPTVTEPEPEPAPTEEGWTKSGSYNVGDMKVMKDSVIKRDAAGGTPAPPTPDDQPAPATASTSDILPDDLVEEKLLGMGASGVVVLSRHKTKNQEYAVKIINISGSCDSKMIAQEINSIDSSCPFLVKAHTAFIREKRLHIVQEYMDKGSLYDVLRCHEGGIPEAVVARIAEQVVRGLSHLHGNTASGKSKMHRDLKPANILLTSSGQVKISDFGVATTAHTKGHSTFVGTTTYMSPERIKGERYSVQSDIWSAGLVFCECILGYYPFRNRNTFIQLLMAITKEQEFEFPEGTSEGCQQFILACLHQLPEKRPTANDLVAFPYLQENANTKDNSHVAQWLSTVDIIPEETNGALAPAPEK